jgi:hypothetical protein
VIRSDRQVKEVFSGKIFIMENPVFELDGNEFSTLSSFYSAVETALTKDLGRHIERNLDAFSVVLRGGFGMYDYEEPYCRHR